MATKPILDSQDFASHDGKVFHSRYGAVTVFQLNNFPQFRATVLLVLLAAGFIGIIKGTETRPLLEQLEK
jgi:hypothetical protein